MSLVHSMPEERSVCRDFERGVCSRGDKCKYFHPEGVAPAESSKLPICKDYQNKGCGRFKCKFLHVTAEEEAEYNRTGQLPDHGGNPEQVAQQFEDSEICRDFIHGKCDRGPRCKFSHPDDGSESARYGKRPRGGGEEFYGPPPPYHHDGHLFDENQHLKKKIADLQREVNELRHMNDTLYAQNSKYRSQIQQKGSAPAPSATYVSGYSAVVYPHYNQPATAYAQKPTTGALPVATANAGSLSPYSYY